MNKTKTLSSTVVRREFGNQLNHVHLLGEEIIVERDGKPMARIVPLGNTQQNQQQLQNIAQSEGKFDFRTSVGIISTSHMNRKPHSPETRQESKIFEIKLRTNQHLFIDTPVIDSFWRKNHKDHYKSVQLFEAVYDLGIQCIISYVSYIQLISQCLATDHKLAAKLRGYLSNSNHIGLYSLDQSVADRAALYTSKSSGISLEDACKIATADITGADFIVTDNQSWKIVKSENVMLLEELRLEQEKTV